MGLADELQKLAELKAAGVLTDAEFADAKARVIAGPAPAPAPAPAQEAHAAPAVEQAPKKPKKSGLTPNVAGLLNSEALNEKVSRCCEVLIKILNNVINNPTEPKYRQLKIGNEVLARDVFSEEGSVELLESVGFEVMNAAVYVIEEQDVDKKVLTEAALQLGRVAGIREMRAADAKRRQMADEIRAEARATKVRDGTIVEHCRSELVSNSDFSFIAESLSAILKPIIAGTHPRTIPLTDTFRTDLWSRPGVQEFLLDLSKWTYTPSATALSLDESVSLSVLQDASVFLEDIARQWAADCAKEEEAKKDAARKELKAVVAAHQAKKKRHQQTARIDFEDEDVSEKKAAFMERAFKHLRGDRLTEPTQTSAALQEEEATAQRLINEITTLMELNGGEATSLMSPWIREGNRLKQKFHQDRDVTYLHGLLEELQAKSLQRK